MYIRRFGGELTHHPSIPLVGQSSQRAIRPGLPLHAHDCVEICLIAQGTVHWEVNGVPVVLEPDSIFFTLPEEVHGSSNTTIEPCLLSYVQVEIETYQASPLGQLDLPIRQRILKGGLKYQPLIEQMLDACANPDPATPSIMTGCLHLLLAGIYRQTRQAERQDAAWRYLQTALDWAETHPIPWPGIKQMAAAAGISSSYLHGLFMKRYGQSPSRYLMHQRLMEAQRLLAGSESITQIAHQLGFSSSQHFATTFRKHTGMTPTAYRSSPQY